MGELRERMSREMQLRGFAAKTQYAYTDAVAGLVRYHGRSPDCISAEEVKDYVLHLINERKLSWSSVNVSIAGIRFFYVETLKRQDVTAGIPPRRTTRSLPEILSTEEIKRLFAVTTNVKHRVLLMTAYATGLRRGELVALKVTDIDSDRMMIRVQQGKGRKDRYTILPSRLLHELRTYWQIEQPSMWLFPGGQGRPHLRPEAAGKTYSKAKRKAGIQKSGGIHTLRHCFATHLLEAGVDVRTIQVLMGHRSIRTTAGYLQLTRKMLHANADLLDRL
jgi:site-specific recombinase XerD